LSSVQGNFHQWFDMIKRTGIGFAIEQVKSLVANCRSPAATVDMPVVVFDLFEGAAIDHSLVAFQTGTLLAFVGDQRNGPKFDAVNRLPRSFGTLGDFHSVKARFFEC